MGNLRPPSGKSRLTVATLSFNQGEYLPRAVRSVLDIPDVDLEYLIVDAGSTDGSRDYLLQIADDPRVSLIFEQDEGPADGLNKALERATGRYFAYLNADDEFISVNWPLALRFLDTNLSVDFCLGNGFVIDEAGRRREAVHSDKPTTTGYVYGSAVFLQQASLFRLDRLGGLRFQRDNHTCWDGEFVVDALLSGAVGRRFSCDLGLFRIYPGTVTTSHQYASRLAVDHERIFCKVRGRRMTKADHVVGKALRSFKKLRSIVRRIRLR